MDLRRQDFDYQRFQEVKEEEPVVLTFKIANPVNVNEQVGMTSAEALKAFLCHNPDMIRVGGIRDVEIGEIAIRHQFH